MNDVMRERLAVYRTAADDADWGDVVRRSRRHRARRIAVPTATVVALGALLAAPALGLDDRLLGAHDGDRDPVPMWLGFRRDGTFCIALANRCEDVDRSRRVVFTLVGGEDRLLRGYANAPRGAQLEVVGADGSRTPVPLTWLEPPGSVLLFSQPLAPTAQPSELVLHAADGSVLARAPLPAQ